MPRVRYTLEQRVFIYDAYVRSGSPSKVRRRFGLKFRDVPVPSRETVHRTVNKVRETGSLQDRKPESKRRVLTEEKLDEIGAKLEHSPRKSLRRLAQETGVSITSARTATILLKQSAFEKLVICVKCASGNKEIGKYRNFITDTKFGNGKSESLSCKIRILGCLNTVKHVTQFEYRDICTIPNT